MKIIITIAFLILLGCNTNNQKKEVSKYKEIQQSSIVSNLTNNDNVELISNSKTIDGITYTVNKISSDDVKKIFSSRFSTDNDYSSFSCFFMDITIENERDITNYKSDLYQNLTERVQYLSFMIKDFITVRTNTKNFACVNSTYDRSYGQLPYSRFFLVFDKITEEDVIFQFDDNYFNNGLINLKL